MTILKSINPHLWTWKCQRARIWCGVQNQIAILLATFHINQTMLFVLLASTIFASNAWKIGILDHLVNSKIWLIWTSRIVQHVQFQFTGLKVVMLCFAQDAQHGFVGNVYSLPMDLMDAVVVKQQQCFIIMYLRLYQLHMQLHLRLCMRYVLYFCIA